MTRRDPEAPDGADAMTHADDDPRGSDDAMTQPDADLSALLDGALDPEAAAAVRARLAAEPGLADRLARLGEADGRLRRLAADSTPDPARLARLRVGVQARIDAAAADGPPAADRTPGGVVHVLRPRAGRLAWVAAALAAGLALYVLAPRSVPGPVDPPRLARDPGEAAPLPVDPMPRRGSAPDPALAASSAEAGRPDEAGRADPGGPGVAPEAVASPDALALAPESAAGSAPAERREPVALAATADPVAPGEDAAEGGPTADPVLGAASDAELAVAVQYDVLTDLEVIENLEVLEMLAMLDTTESL